MYVRGIFYTINFCWFTSMTLLKKENSALNWITGKYSFIWLLFMILVVTTWLSDLANKRVSILYIFSKISCKIFEILFSFHIAIHYCFCFCFEKLLHAYFIKFKWYKNVQNYYLERYYFQREALWLKNRLYEILRGWHCQLLYKYVCVYIV